MKRILITGANSYVGTNVEKWLLKEPDKYHIETLDMKNSNWKDFNFSKFDVVFHVAGIAHVSNKKSIEDLYYKINRDLAVETAIISKKSGVKQFIFMSSIIVYGESSKSVKVIDKYTVPKPSNFYGNSKLQAEKLLKNMSSDKFRVVVLRPPLIYGKCSKGNYPKLAKLARKLPLFPCIYNERSMLHIDNLCEFIKVMIDFKESGLFFPQNEEYVQTSCMVKMIAETNGKKIWMTKLFNPVLRLMYRIRVVNKLFGNLVYEKSMSCYPRSDYQIRSFTRSIELSEK